MDFELPAGYPMTENTTISIFSHLQDDDNGRHEDIDTFRAQILLEGNTMKIPTENDKYSGFNGGDLIFGTAQPDTTENVHISQPIDNRLMDDVHSARIGSSEGINVSNQYNNNNRKENDIAENRHNNGNDNIESIFDSNNNNKLNFDDEKTEDEEGLKVNVPAVKRVSSSILKSRKKKKKKSKRRRIHDFTVYKLKNIKHIENSLRKYLLVSNILLRLHKIEM